MVCLQTDKVLIRLHGCAGWSRTLLTAYAGRHVFAWRSPYTLWCANKDKDQAENLHNLISLHLNLRSLSINRVPREDCSDWERIAWSQSSLSMCEKVNFLACHSYIFYLWYMSFINILKSWWFSGLIRQMTNDDIFFLFSPKRQVLTFHANCLQ